MSTRLRQVLYPLTMRFGDLRAIQSPAERVKAVEDALPEVNREMFEIRRDAVREMRATMSLEEVAKALGKTKGRIQQLERESGTGSEYRAPKAKG